MTRLFSLLTFCLLSCITVSANTLRPARILLIPLDDRPPCLQFTEKIGSIAGVQIIAPPLSLLGKFTRAGESDRIVKWLVEQDLRSYDALIVSFDMLAYGGLVASRVFETEAETALKRIQAIRRLKEKHPLLKIYGQSVIMRLAPTGDGKNEAYREKLARWADISPYPENREETTALEAVIPTEALDNYKEARRRNLRINREAIRMTETGILDYLILSQDDAKPRGIHVADREQLAAEVRDKNLDERILIQPGTDEISMLLLARALNIQHQAPARVYVKYSSAEAANTAMPFEDRPLRQTVSFDIQAAGAREIHDEAAADLLFYVFTSRFESGAAAAFSREILKKVSEGRRVMVADVDPRGNTQGGDPAFSEELIRLSVLPDLYSYASWNTAGNTVGTSVSQGLVFHLAESKLSDATNADTFRKAQDWFTFHRVLDDYYFHTLIRPKANAQFRQNNRSGFERPEDTARRIEAFSRKELEPHFKRLRDSYFSGKARRNHKPVNLRFSLPWNRTFEALIDFELLP